MLWRMSRVSECWPFDDLLIKWVVYNLFDSPGTWGEWYGKSNGVVVFPRAPALAWRPPHSLPPPGSPISQRIARAERGLVADPERSGPRSRAPNPSRGGPLTPSDVLLMCTQNGQERPVAGLWSQLSPSWQGSR